VSFYAHPVRFRPAGPNEHLSGGAPAVLMHLDLVYVELSQHGELSTGARAVGLCRFCNLGEIGHRPFVASWI